MFVRRLILHCASWLEKRLAMVYESFPLLTFAIADGRRSYTDRRSRPDKQFAALTPRDLLPSFLTSWPAPRPRNHPEAQGSSSSRWHSAFFS
eukprot:2763909-Pyramimonas_sp.AAC.1